MWIPVILWIIVVAVMATLLVRRSKWKLNNPEYQEWKADKYVDEKRASRDRREVDSGNSPERRKGYRGTN